MNIENINKLEPIIQKMGDKSLDNYKKIKQLVEFINQNDESVMVDYDLETCMYERIGDVFKGQNGQNYPLYLQQQDLGENETIHKFRKHFGQQEELLSSGTDITNLDENDKSYLDEESNSGFVNYFKESNSVITNDVINMVFD